MNREVLTRRSLRGVAIAIAVAAVFDPAVTTNRATKPTISVVAVDGGGAALADHVAGALERTFTVARGPIAGASATVVIGDRPPAHGTEVASPAFAVLLERNGPTVTIESIHAPVEAPAESGVPVEAVVHVTGARGRSLEGVLRAGDLVVDRFARKIATDDERVSLGASFAPTGAGISVVRLSLGLDGVHAADADVAIDARDTRWPVLFFDPRPSWMSTFVRRAIERDTRFVVTSRVVTSRAISTDAGRPPARLDDLAALSLFSAVVVGAPEALSSQDVAGLEAFLRRRGGSVVLLLDRRESGAYDRLTDVARWTTRGDNTPVAILTSTPMSGTIRATELAWPASLPAGTNAVALAGDRPVVWRSPVGAGRLVVSGALDAWRFRDRAQSSFDQFWRMLIAESAAETPPATSARLSQTIVLPGETIDALVTVRDAAIQSPSARASRASVVATLDSGPPVRLWPAGAPGEFTGTLRAPAKPGTYRVSVSADGNRTDVPFIVATNVLRAAAPAPDLLEAWTRAHGGRSFRAADLRELAPALRQAIRPMSRMETWHPMRSAWWIIPFALALSAEWWLRRRRGLP